MVEYIKFIPDREVFEYHSRSGEVYTLRLVNTIDDVANGVDVWECNCPGFRYRGRCRHFDTMVRVGVDQIIESGRVEL